MFDDIPEDKTKRVLFHHFVELIFVGERKFWEKEETIGGIFSKDPDPSHVEHPFYRGGIFYG
jgi:hypothetical protein